MKVDAISGSFLYEGECVFIARWGLAAESAAPAPRKTYPIIG